MKKYSYGIACVSVENEYKMLMVRRRNTYEFIEFVFGKYPADDNRLIRMFSKMTIDEKLDIMSHNFNQMWWRIFLDEPRKPMYFTSKSKFETTFLCDDGARLDRLLRAAGYSTRIWEIPKGHGKKGESEIDIAVREFTEETRLPSNFYHIYPEATRSYSFIDSNITYVNKYFIAASPREFNLKIDMKNHDQIHEICEIKWMTIEEIKILCSQGVYNLAKPIINYVKKHI